MFVSTGMLVYWVRRTQMLLHGSEDEITETLENDLWWTRRLLLGLRAMFFPSMDLRF
jgi:hypothetical protein